MDDLKYEEKDDFLETQHQNTNDYYNDNPLDKHLEDITSEPEIMNWCKDDEEAKKFVLECGSYLKSEKEEDYEKLLEICDKKEYDANNKEDKVFFVKNFYSVIINILIFNFHHLSRESPNSN